MAQVGRRERALAHDSRVALIEALRNSDDPLDARELADEVGLHVNTVRSHLDLLLQAGLVRRRAEARNRPGRPRQLYTATAVEPANAQGYRRLATMLASFIATNVEDPAAAAEETGHRWGRHLTPAPEPFTRMSESDAYAQLIGLLDDFGFAPRPTAQRSSEIELRNCPFRDVAERHPEVACSLHLGLMRGAMAQSAAPIQVLDLLPFVTPEMCLTHIGALPAEAGTRA